MSTAKEGEKAAPAATALAGFSLDRVFRVRDDLRRVLRHEHEGHCRRGEGYSALVAHAYDVLTEACGCEYGVVFDSLRHLAGVSLTRRLLDDASWRLAGNMGLLRKGQAVPPWRGQKAEEWVPVQFLSADVERSKGRRPFWRFRLQVLAGTPCPLTLECRWSFPTCAYLAPQFGFTKPNRDGYNPHPFLAPEEFVTLRAEALVEPRLSVDAPGFEKVRLTPAAKDWNREQQRFRARSEPGYGCPFGVPPGDPCHRCAVGWKECRAATHRNTYEFRPCPRCGADEAPFDPGSDAESCVSCRRG